ncbi:MAG: hypothetical protein J5824_05240 [Lachnospiraceae bacterium]|nr:hypothetical protein [Lachnospiraceae bacterium]
MTKDFSEITNTIKDLIENAGKDEESMKDELKKAILNSLGINIPEMNSTDPAEKKSEFTRTENAEESDLTEDTEDLDEDGNTDDTENDSKGPGLFDCSPSDYVEECVDDYSEMGELILGIPGAFAGAILGCAVGVVKSVISDLFN